MSLVSTKEWIDNIVNEVMAPAKEKGLYFTMFVDPGMPKEFEIANVELVSDAIKKLLMDAILKTNEGKVGLRITRSYCNIYESTKDLNNENKKDVSNESVGNDRLKEANRGHRNSVDKDNRGNSNKATYADRRFHNIDNEYCNLSAISKNSINDDGTNQTELDAIDADTCEVNIKIQIVGTDDGLTKEKLNVLETFMNKDFKENEEPDISKSLICYVNINNKLKSINTSLTVDSLLGLGTNAGFKLKPEQMSDEILGEYIMPNVDNDNATDDDTNDSTSEVEITIKGVDVNKGLEYMQGDMESYLMILKEYIKSATKASLTLVEAYKEKDWNSYRIAAHGIKSGSYSIGADKLGDIAKGLEFAARDEDLTHIDNNHSIIFAKLDEVIANIVEALNSLGMSVDDKKGDSRKDKLLAAIDDFDKDIAINILEELEKENGRSEVYDRIRDALEQFNYLDAADIAQNELS